ncbi:putative mitochondrial carrier [Phaeomoniella chlamydospora]|uniref:Putative mitochondrial carrier n=1 Tax=Phaeomoniella chlamydospora TaxID=158046 RepID=A0A0G2EDX7_PHACM|nr:putative mitochondrial carrier [Phaeomoniella chlamydospora]
MSLRDAANNDDVFHILPQDDDRDEHRKTPRSNAATGASAAGVRALSAQIVGFYFRAPVKAFFRTRVDYLAYAKAISPQTDRWSWRNTTPGLLTTAIQNYGWKFIPEQMLPPMLANVTVGAMLYTSYLQILGALHEPSSTRTKRVFPPPSPTSTFTAGTAAGALQSLVAAPLDALQVRFDRSDAIDNKYKNIVSYSRQKLAEIGYRGIFAGWSLSLLKDSIGCGVFFTTFEWVKAQAYYRFVAWYYSRESSPYLNHGEPQRVKPHYAIEPLFLLGAGISATLSQAFIQYPLSTLQTLHYERLEHIDQATKSAITRRDVLRTYYHAYETTLREAQTKAHKTTNLISHQRMNLIQWLYRGFWWNTIRQVPSTAAGLVIFELVRRKYGTEPGEEVHVKSRLGDVIIY